MLQDSDTSFLIALNQNYKSIYDTSDLKRLISNPHSRIWSVAKCWTQ